jgi:thiol-disulfide isomerase/thioredoxin
VKRVWRREQLVITVFLIVTWGFIAGCGKTPMNRTDIGQKWKGRMAPDFTIGRLNGEQFELDKEIGKKMIILNVFGTWCAPCRAELPALYRIYASSRDEVLLFGIALNEKKRAVRKFFDELNVAFPAALEVRKGEGVTDLYETPTVPTTIVIGVNGKVQLYKPGMLRKWDFRSLKKLIRKNRKLTRKGQAIGSIEYQSKIGAN